MIHNIFKPKKAQNPKNLPIITTDIHEKNSLVPAELIKSKEIKLEFKPLKIGDYLINNIGIERKTISDLINSMISRRLYDQLKNLESYDKSILIIEGNLNEIYTENKKIINSIRGLILSISINHPTSIINSQNPKETARYLITLAKQQEKKPSKTSLHSKIPKTLAEQKEYILEAFPKIGPKKAKELLNKFKSIKNIINAKDTELEPILKSQTKDFKDLIGA